MNMSFRIECENDQCVDGCECNAKDLYDKSKKYLEEKEAELELKFKEELENAVAALKEKFNLILHNEQVRASHMLREAHRDRQEKIQALQTQLECKNLSAIMYVMCIERRRSKLEKYRLIEQYSNYIHALQDILTDGQSLILHLARGYKTAARVDNEWREKMISIIKEFQAFICHYTGGSAETSQFYLDLPNLLKTETSVNIDPTEDPCYHDEPAVEELAEEEVASKGKWWEGVEAECRPFLMFADMSDFEPDHRRKVARLIKAQKTVPAQWKNYMFNSMFLKRDCSNIDKIKYEYPDISQMPKYKSWHRATQYSSSHSHDSFQNDSRRDTTTSVGQTENMGSILKIISASSTYQSTNKTILLAARDSMEIQSTTKLLEKQRKTNGHNVHCTPSNVVLDIKKRRQSCLEEMIEEEVTTSRSQDSMDLKEEDLGSKYKPNDSMILKTCNSNPDRIALEKICPAEQCKLLTTDEFTKSLPPYMRGSPFVHYEQTFEQYVPLSPEQLEILTRRIEEKKRQDSALDSKLSEDPLAEWTESGGVGTQTGDSLVASELSFPCTCNDPPPTAVSSGYIPVLDVKNLFPMKIALDEIKSRFFHDENIEFNRFAVIGENCCPQATKCETNENFSSARLENIKNILKKHPSLLDIFQANTQC